MSAPKCPRCGRLLAAFYEDQWYCTKRDGGFRHDDGPAYRVGENGRLVIVPEAPPDPGDARRQKLVDTVADRWHPGMARSGILGRGDE